MVLLWHKYMKFRLKECDTAGRGFKKYKWTWRHLWTPLEYVKTNKVLQMNTFWEAKGCCFYKIISGLVLNRFGKSQIWPTIWENVQNLCWKCAKRLTIVKKRHIVTYIKNSKAHKVLLCKNKRPTGKLHKAEGLRSKHNFCVFLNVSREQVSSDKLNIKAPLARPLVPNPQKKIKYQGYRLTNNFEKKSTVGVWIPDNTGRLEDWIANSNT